MPRAVIDVAVAIAVRTAALLLQDNGVGVQDAGVQERAIDAYGHALRLRPGHLEATAGLACALLRAGPGHTRAARGRFWEAVGGAMRRQGMVAAPVPLSAVALVQSTDGTVDGTVDGTGAGHGERGGSEDIGEGREGRAGRANREGKEMESSERYDDGGARLKGSAKEQERHSPPPPHEKLADDPLRGETPHSLTDDEQGVFTGEEFARFGAQFKKLGSPGAVDEAAWAYREAVRRQPSTAELHYQLGSALLLAGRHGDAVAALENAVGLDPRHASACNNIGAAYYRLGRKSLAREWTQRSVALRDGCQVRFNLGLMLKGEGDAAAASRHLRAAMRLCRDREGVLRDGDAVDETDIQRELAVTLSQTGQLEPAAALLQASIRTLQVRRA